MDILNRLIATFEFENELLKEVFQPHLFIGGLPIEQDRDILKIKRCSIVIGTLGRLMQLV
jgi:superfamily II DNA/RNA helicase